MLTDDEGYGSFTEFFDIVSCLRPRKPFDQPEIILYILDLLLINGNRSKAQKAISQSTLHSLSLVSKRFQKLTLDYLYLSPLIGNILFPSSFGYLIKYLDISHIQFQEPNDFKTLKFLSENLPQLRRLNLWIEHFNWDTLEMLICCSQELTSFGLKGQLGHWYPTPSLERLPKAIQKLTTLDIDITGNGSKAFIPFLFNNIGPNLLSLRIMGILNLDFYDCSSTISHKSKKIQYLLFSWAGLHTTSIINLADNLAFLTSLELRGCVDAVTRESINYLLTKCTRLIALDLSFTKGHDDVLKVLSHAANPFVSLILAGYNCSENILLQLIELKGSALLKLSVAWLDFAMSENLVKAIYFNCKYLQELDMRGCRAVTLYKLGGVRKGWCIDYYQDQQTIQPHQNSATKSAITAFIFLP
jgi:hypothetical protein